jgi:hypothetical protein
MTIDGERLIRAAYTTSTITIYRAYGPEIAEPAVAVGTFVPPFSRDRLSRRAIQIGLSREAVDHYCDGWIRSVTDITATVRQLEQLVRSRQGTDAGRLLTAEQVYPLSPVLARRIGADPVTGPTPRPTPRRQPAGAGSTEALAVPTAGQHPALPGTAPAAQREQHRYQRERVGLQNRCAST